MVNTGVSRACKSCKQRHKKCDELRPTCIRCSKAGRRCYYEFATPSELIFRNFTSRHVPCSREIGEERHGTRPVTDGRPTVLPDHNIRPAMPNQLVVLENDLIAKFLHDFCVVAPDRSVSRGHLGGLPPLLSTADFESDLASAAMMVALGNAGMQQARQNLLDEAARHYTALLRSFQKTLSLLEGPLSVTTFMTIVLLGLYEIITATKWSPSKHVAHIDGLFAILNSADSSFDLIGAFKLFSMANSLPLKIAIEQSLFLNVLYMPVANSAVGSLDEIIVRINATVGGSLKELKPGLDTEEALRSYLQEVEAIADKLSIWQRCQAIEWQPCTVSNSPNIKLCPCFCAEEEWSGTTEVYYDLYVSSVLNTYRKCHVLILDLQRRITEKIETISGHPSEYTERQTEWRDKAQNLAGLIISSFPYHLTELSKLSSMGQTADVETVAKLTSQVGRPVGGLLLMYPIYTLRTISIIDPRTREFARKTLEWIGKTMGIGEALTLADDDREVPFAQAARGHVLIWAGMLIQSV